MNVSQQSPSSPQATPPAVSAPAVPAPGYYADPLEQRDPWRALWNFSTSDMLLAVLLAMALLALFVMALLPQIPAGGTASPVPYGQWQSQARGLTGGWYGLLLSLGLFDVLQTGWFKLLLSVGSGVVALRLFNDVARMRLADMPADVLRDELRLRVTDRAPMLSALTQQLRRQRYRVITSALETLDAPDSQNWLHANRAPLAEALSACFHAGLLLALLGALINFILGWQILYSGLTPDQAAVLPSNGTLVIQPVANAPTDTLTLALQPAGGQAQLHSGERANLAGVNIRLRQITPGLRVSALRAGQPLTITVSNYAAGRRDALLSFSANDRERGFVLPSVALMARVVIPSEDALGSGRLQLFSLGSGVLITDTPLQPRIEISGTVLSFAADTGALIDAYYRPGMGWLWFGLVAAALGLVGTLLYPVQRLVIRHHGHWTEFYGSGRQIRHTINELLH